MTARLRILAEDGALSLGLGPGWRRATPALLVLGLLAVANVAAGLWITLPAWRAAAVEGAVERAGQQAQETLEPALRTAREAYGPVVEAERDVAQLRATIGARSGTVSEIVATLRAAIDAAGLSAERISYQAAPVEELGLTRLQIDLPVRGSYAQLRTFLDQLLDGPIFAIVERVGASTPSSSDPRSSLLMNLVLSVFMAPEGEDLGAVEAVAESPDPAAFVGRDPVALARTLRARLDGLPSIPLAPADFDLGLERLDQPTDPGAATRRNLFAVVSVPVAPPTVDPAERARRQRDRTFVPEPVMPYDLLGVIRTEAGLMATLSDGADVFNVVEGDRLPAGLLVKSISLVDVVLEEGRRESVLSLRKEDDIPAGDGRRKKKAGGTPRRIP